MSGVGGPQRTVKDGRTYVSVLGVAHALGRSTRSITRLEQSGVLRPVKNLNGSPNERWYSTAEVSALSRIADETGFRHSKGAIGAFKQAVAAWRRNQADQGQPKRARWTEISGGTDEETESSHPRRPRRIRLGNLAQYRTDRDDDWVPPGQEPLGGARRLADPRCPDCAQQVYRVQDAAGRQIWTCSAHGVVQPVEGPDAARGALLAGITFSAPPGLSAPARGRPGRLTRQAPVGAVRAPQAAPGRRLTFIAPRDSYSPGS
jgi:hypothetical protein